MRKRTLILILGILWQSFIFGQSMLSGDVSSTQSGVIVDVLYPIVQSVGLPLDLDSFSFLVRKLAHFTEYAILAFIWYYVYTQYKLTKFLPWLVVVHGFIAASIDETIQRFTPNRSGELRDVLIDILGILSAVILVLVTQKMSMGNEDKDKS